MRYGNCLFGSFVLLWTERKNNPRLIVRYRPQTRVPHFMVITRDNLYHYKIIKNVLPWPLCYIIFMGEFQKLEHNQEQLFQKAMWMKSLKKELSKVLLRQLYRHLSHQVLCEMEDGLWFRAPIPKTKSISIPRTPDFSWRRSL